MTKTASKFISFVAAALGLLLSACAPSVLPNGQKPAWASYMLPSPPEDGYMSTSLLEREIHPDSAIVAAIKRHETICAETGCPEWTAFIEKKRKETEGMNSRQTAWRVHLSFRSFINVRPRQQYGKEYHASPAEFFAAGKMGDGKAAALAEFMAFKELGWDTENLRYSLFMVGRYYTAAVMIRADDWSNGHEHMLHHSNDFNQYPDYYRKAALIYSTNGEKLWEQEWARKGRYALNATGPSVNTVTGDRTTQSFFY